MLNLTQTRFILTTRINGKAGSTAYYDGDDGITKVIMEITVIIHIHLLTKGIMEAICILLSLLCLDCIII